MGKEIGIIGWVGNEIRMNGKDLYISIYFCGKRNQDRGNELR